MLLHLLQFKMRELLSCEEGRLAAMTGKQQTLSARAAIFHQQLQQGASAAIVKARKSLVKKKRQLLLGKRVQQCKAQGQVRRITASGAEARK